MNREPFIATVVLNYKSYNDTIDCVNSLLKEDYTNHHIVIVENGSVNGSAEVIREVFGTNTKVTILESAKNLGFAKGNNLGIRYAHETLQAEFVFVLNSDTLVPSSLFRSIAATEVDGVGVVSPQVVDLSGGTLAPSENSDDIIVRAQKQVKALYLAMVLSVPGVAQLFSLYKRLKPSKCIVAEERVNQYKKYVLQGCSYFLTPDFFKYYRNIYPETFLYWEEINLLMQLQKVGLASICILSDPVIHKVSKSTSVLFGKSNFDRKKLQYSYYSMKKSRPMFSMSYEELKQAYDV